MLHYLTIGTILGLSAGFAPGPLLTLVISETFQHDVKAGIKVALAPIITDLPIIILTLFVLSKLAAFQSILGGISLAGGCFILWVGCANIRIKGVDLDLNQVQSRSLSKGILANVLSPHPYLFWLSVGAPIMTKAMTIGIEASIAFIISFYFFLVGAKIVLAVVSSKSKSVLKGSMYVYTMRFLGCALCVLATILLYDGLKMVGII